MFSDGPRFGLGVGLHVHLQGPPLSISFTAHVAWAMALSPRR